MRTDLLYTVIAADRCGEHHSATVDGLRAACEVAADFARRYPRDYVGVSNDELADGAEDSTNRDGLTDDERDEIDLAIAAARKEV